jgi:ATP-dependent helicase HrpA
VMNFKVVDENGRQLGMGRNLAALRSEFAQQAEQSFRAMAAPQESAQGATTDITDWDFGELPVQREVHRGGVSLVGYPALVDRETHCDLELFDDPQLARAAHRAGLLRLYRLQMRQQIAGLEKGFVSLAPVQMRAATIPCEGHREALASQIITAALERVCLAEPWPHDRAGFLERREDARGRLGLIAQEIARLATQIVDEAIVATRKLVTLRGADHARADMEQQLARLVGRRFVVDTSADALGHLPRYLKGIALRVDKVRTEPARDQLRSKEFAPLQTRWQRELAARRGQFDPRLDEFRWMLEELRISLFAQELRTPYPVSVKRLEKVWQTLRL